MFLSRGVSTKGKGLGGTVKSMFVVSSELWINTLHRRILLGLWLIDTVLMSLLVLVVVGMIL